MVYLFPRDSDGGAGDPARVGVTVPRKVGSAVVRNRVKRQLREALARLGPGTAAGSDVVLVARPGLAEAIDQHGFDWLTDEVRPLIAPEPDAE